MSNHEYALRILRIKETILKEVDKDIVVATQHDVEGAKKHLQPLVDKLRRLEVFQQKEIALEPEIAAIIKDEMRLEEHLMKLIVTFIQEEDEEKQGSVLNQMMQVLSSLKELSVKEQAALK